MHPSLLGDGVTDDTEAINAAISHQPRCGKDCDSSTTTPAVVYFPPGKYLVSKPIIAMYYTQMVGDAVEHPVLLASKNFDGMAVIDANPYKEWGFNWYQNQNNCMFFVKGSLFIHSERSLIDRG